MFSVSGLAANTLASDLSLFGSNVFGGIDANGFDINPNLSNAWSMLLSGSDVITGTKGIDYRGIPGLGAGNDSYNMQGGNDWVRGGQGHYTINGGDGFDTLSFENTHWVEGNAMTRGINVNVATGTVIDAWGFTDKVISVEQFIGSSYIDIFIGGVSEDNFYTLRGNDIFSGGGGNDWVKYDYDNNQGGTRGIVAVLSTTVVGVTINGTIRDGFGNLDRTTNIENAGGTRYNDVFIGSSVQNNFFGAEGKDSYTGDGGNDFVFFFWNLTNAVQTGVAVDLTRTTGQIINDGYGNAEEAVSIENIVGSRQNDRIKGSVGNNVIEGYLGADTMTGAGGSDYFVFGHSSTFGQGDIITDFNAAGNALNIDILQIFVSNCGASTTLHLVNGLAATQAVGTFVFNTANDILYWDADGTGAQAKVAVVTRQVSSPCRPQTLN